MHGITAKGKPFKDYLDVRGHNSAIEFLIGLVHDKEELTEADIRNLHRIILGEPYEVPFETPEGLKSSRTISVGSYKTQANHVKTITGETHYYVEPNDVPFAVNELITWFRNQKRVAEFHPLLIASIFHHRFTEIHPFDDGNGRMGRLLMNLILMQYDFPPLVIKQEKEERNQYYFALSAADSGDFKTIVEFLGECLNRSLELYIKAIRGENIDEPDDFDKEFLLFKREFEGYKHRVDVKRDSKTQKLLSQNFIKPFFNKLIANHSKLQEFFFDFNALFNVNSPNLFPRYEAFDEQYLGNVADDLSSNELFFALELKDFKSEKNSFTVFTQINVKLLDFRFELHINRMPFRNGSVLYNYFKFPNSQLVYSDYYNKIPSKEEIDLLANTISKSTIQYIKDLDQISASGHIPLDQKILHSVWKTFAGPESSKMISIDQIKMNRANVVEIYPSGTAHVFVTRKAEEFLEYLSQKYDYSLTGIGINVISDDLPF